MSVRDSLITGNGTVVVSSWGTVCDRCILTGHRDPDYGPLGATVDATWVSVADCALIGNAGDAIRGDGSYSQATNCTVADNAGNGMEVDYLPTTNCIFWGNFPPQIVSTANPPEVTYSDVQGGWPGSSNLDANPQFPVIAGGSWSQAGEYRLTTFQLTLTDSNAAWTAGGLVGYFVRPDPTSPFQTVIIANTATTLTIWADWQTVAAMTSSIPAGAAYEIHDYHLPSGSPCINRGYNYVAGDLDLDGQPRIQSCRVDLGAYESPWEPVGPSADCNQNGVSDDCDVTSGSSLDTNQNQIPDECDGACCLPVGTCELWDATTCASLGAVYLGDGTNCASGGCPEPVGACCFAHPPCQILTQGDCVLAGGQYKGHGTPCSPYPCVYVGDLNCDGTVDFGDINPFVLYLSHHSTWQAQYPTCNTLNGDIDGDGTCPSFGDINPFVALLSSGGH